MGNMFNPMSVMMKQGSGTYLQPNAVRATGAGPFDAAYRQNLATYGAGNFAPQGPGGTSFNPTNPINFGSPVGGGNAPEMGTPVTLLGQAMGRAGTPIATSGTAPSTPSPTANANAPQLGTLSSWLEQFLGGFQLPGVANG